MLKKTIQITDFREQSQRWQENTADLAVLLGCHQIKISLVKVNSIHQVGRKITISV